MNCLVTGSTGLLGSSLIKRIDELDLYDSVRVVVHKKNITNLSIKFWPVNGDLRDREFCREITNGIDLVFHCAASTAGANVIESNPLSHVTQNIVMNVELLEAAYLNQVKNFIYMGSTTAYPYIPGREMVETEMFDGEPYDKYFAVGWMKRYTTKLCELYATKLNPKMNCVVCNISNAYGIGDRYDFDTSHVLPALIRRFAEKQNPLECWGNASRDFIFVDDVVDALIKVVELTTFEQINIGSGTQVSITEVIELLSKITGHYPEIKYLEGKPQMIPSRHVNVEKAKKVLNFKAKTSLENGLRQTLDWYQKTYHTEQYK